MESIKSKGTAIMVLFVVLWGNVISQNCTQCDNTTPPSGMYATEIGELTTASGDYSFAGGYISSSEGDFAFAFGNHANASGNSCFALGTGVTAANYGTFALGTFCEATATGSIVIGEGFSVNNHLVNNIGRSFMIGFSSTKPTFFVSESIGVNSTGRVGIGDVTDPEAKLHIKGDEDESADILLEPGSNMEFARIKFGTTGNIIEARGSQDLNFYTTSDFVFWDANVGIGNYNPRAKLQISDGDIFIEDIDHGIIMKSPDGQCWRGTVNNDGELNFNAVDCELLTSAEKPATEPNKKITVFPNPSKGQVTVKTEGFVDILTVKMKNISGATILTKEIRGSKIKLPTNDIAPGNYILEVISPVGNIVYSEKIVIM